MYFTNDHMEIITLEETYWTFQNPLNLGGVVREREKEEQRKIYMGKKVDREGERKQSCSFEKRHPCE